MDIVVANGFVMESCTFFSREYHCCVLHNTRCKCEDYNPRNSKPITNYDLLVRKTPEELARWIWAVQSEIKHEDLFSTGGWYIWLMQEAEEGEA